MHEVSEQGLALVFRDDYEEVDCIPGDDRYMYEYEGVKPATIAAICGALLACGLLNEKSVIKSVRRATSGLNPWKVAGLLDLMLSREINRY